MTKKDFKGGLSTLLGEALSEAARADETAAPTQMGQQTPDPQPSNTDILDTVNDEELREALERKRGAHRGRPRKDDAIGSTASQYGRMTFVTNKAKLQKIKEIAFRETLTMKEVIESAMDLAIAKYEEKHGEVTPHPKSWHGDRMKLFD